MVVCSFEAQLPPDRFLGIEPGQVGRQVGHLDLGVGCQVLLHPRSPMPARSVYEQVHNLSSPPPPQAVEQGTKPWVLPRGARIMPCLP